MKTAFISYEMLLWFGDNFSVEYYCSHSATENLVTEYGKKEKQIISRFCFLKYFRIFNFTTGVSVSLSVCLCVYTQHGMSVEDKINMCELVLISISRVLEITILISGVVVIAQLAEPTPASKPSLYFKRTLIL